MLTSFGLAGFKSYRDAATLPLAPLTVLIGANASGKSNALEALRLLSWLAQGGKLANIQSTLLREERGVRGIVDRLFAEGAESFTLEASTDREEWNRLAVTIAKREGGLCVSAESVTHEGAKVPLYAVERVAQGRGTDLAVAYNNFAKGGIKPRVTCSDQTAVFTQLTSPATFEAEHKLSRERIPPVTKEFEEELSSILFLDPVPGKMRGYSFRTEDTLHSDGSNVSAVVCNLLHDFDIQRMYDSGDEDFSELLQYRQDQLRLAKATALAFVQSLPEQDISGIDFIEEPRGAVMLTLTESFGGQRREYDASLLSDGTLRVLAIAAAMLSAPEGSLVVIEEIDNGVHPSRAHKLLANIREVAERRKLRVLLSTHNPALLDALPDPALPDVLFCYRDPKDGGSRVVRLQDLPQYPSLVAQDTLGALVTSGALDRFVKQPPTEDRKAKALAWLEAMRSGSGGA